jgi:hypothetical protein
VNENMVATIKYKEARARIENVENFDMKMFLKATYLLVATGCEMAGDFDLTTSSYRREHNIIYGPKGTDVTETTIDLDQPEFNLADVIKFSNLLRSKEFRVEQIIHDISKVSIALFNVTRSKQKLEDGKKPSKQIVALPMSKDFEPWTRELYDYFRAKNNDYVFPFNRTTAYNYVRSNKIFKDCLYTIKEYRISRENKLFQVNEHPRKLYLDGLRYLRQDELREKYDFDWVDLESYTGLKFSDITRSRRRGVLSRKDWRRYIEKLCTA